MGGRGPAPKQIADSALRDAKTAPVTTEARPVPPAELGSTGKALWRAVWSDLADHLELDEVEVCALLDACRLEDRAAALARRVKRDGIMLASSQGERLHPAIAEERQCRMAARRLVASIDMSANPARRKQVSEQASAAAQRRWARGA